MSGFLKTTARVGSTAKLESLVDERIGQKVSVLIQLADPQKRNATVPLRRRQVPNGYLGKRERRNDAN